MASAQLSLNLDSERKTSRDFMQRCESDILKDKYSKDVQSDFDFIQVAEKS